MKYLAIILLVLSLAACHRKSVPQIVTETKDSLVYKVVPHDTTIYIPGAMVEVRDTIPCPELNFDTVATNGNVKLHVTISNGHLTASCKADSLQKVISILKETLTHYQLRILNPTLDRNLGVEDTKRYIPKWVWWLLGVNALLALYRFRKPLIKLFL